LTETVRLPGVDPLVEPRLNHAPPDAEAVKLMAELVLLARFRVCEPGVVPPVWEVKLKLAGLRLRVGLLVAVVTFKVTGIETGVLVAPVLATETDPV
jgi:hypothetical protein